MELIKCVNQKSKLSIEHVNSFNNKTATIIGSKGLKIDLNDGTDLSRKIKQYISNGILYIDKTPEPEPETKSKAENPFAKASSKVELKSKPQSKPQSDSKGEIKVENSLSEIKENGSKTNSRPTAKKK